MENRTKISGLTRAEVEAARREHGANTLTKRKGRSFIRRFFGNLNDPVIKILLAALAVNVIFSVRGGGWIETAGIAVAVFLAAFISTLSEHGSEAAFARLDDGAGQTLCRVRRAAGIAEIPISEVVVGDILLLSVGEKAAADCRVTAGRVGVDQSSMTGENGEIDKRPTGKFLSEPACAEAVFRGCPILSGAAEAQVFAVGDRTFLGEISREVQEQTRESPLRVRLSVLARQISRIGYLLAALVIFAYLFNTLILDSGFNSSVITLKLTDYRYMFSKLLSALTLGLTVIVMAVPEGLPMMIAVVLSSNLRRMLRDNVLVRKPVGIESAGSMNILFTDKTGTLTEGRLGVGALHFGDGSSFDGADALNRRACRRVTGLYRLSCFLNTESRLTDGGVSGGNPTDSALLASAELLGQPSGFRILSRTPFDSEKKYSCVTVVTVAGDEKLTLLKGAPETVLPRLDSFISADGDLHPLDGAALSERLASLTAGGARVILIAFGGGEGRFTLLCIAELSDRVRAEAKRAVSDLRGAGIQTVMITGDNRDTAKMIARRCGILQGERDLCLTSDELSRLSDLRLSELLPRLAVVARALPTDKSRLVRVAQDAGLVVGMTGDGVNDAPALRRADVGFAMGSGTQVAKEAGDIIILDDNLASVVSAVLYGRTVFKSIRKFITLQLTMNLCACGVSMIGPFIGIDAPVTVVQMLWINMIMDTLGGLAFAGEPPLAASMREKPKRRDEPILNGYMVSSLLLHGGFSLALGVFFLKSPFVASIFRSSPDGIYHLTAFFAFFIFSGVINCFCARTDRLNLFSGLRRNRVFLLIMTAVCALQTAFVYLGGTVLRTAPLTLRELGITLALSLIVVPADFLRKLLIKLFGKSRGY